MTSVAEHYANHLAPVYVWMAGGIEAGLAAGESELQALHLPGQAGDRVLDLGAGFGAHSIPLARRGAHVTAVDTSAELLRVLRQQAQDLPIEAVQTDLAAFLRNDHNQYAAILCMGDTITHLSSRADFDELLTRSARALAPGGVLVLTFRDYTTALQDESCFIPVRSDDDRILTCFLDFDQSTLKVHDILHERVAGSVPMSWKTRVSAYTKLRIAPEDLIRTLRELDLSVRSEPGMRGMVRIVATRNHA